ANTSGALLDRKYHLDMARIGLGMYGYGNEKLKPVKTVTANVVAVKSIKVGSVVGYGARYIANRDMRVAIVNIGYAQGFARSLVGATISVGSRPCKVIAVCMAMIIVDIEEYEINVGDVVTLLGDGINIENNTVSVYELLCNLK
ncbi:MAG: hypothetical protein K2M64_02605, partial [Clostridia bacterium]|nr:hypothetical protein [Clostridia bacterium]